MTHRIITRGSVILLCYYVTGVIGHFTTRKGLIEFSVTGIKIPAVYLVESQGAQVQSVRRSTE